MCINCTYWKYMCVFNLCFRYTLEFGIFPDFLKKMKGNYTEYMWTYC